MNLPTEFEQLRRERDYYQRQVDELSGESVRRDYEISTLRHALKQRTQGFALLSDLQQFIGGSEPLSSIFCYAVQSINGTLGMDKSLVLTPCDNCFVPETWIGCAARESNWGEVRVQIDAALLGRGETILVNSQTPDSPLIAHIRATFELPYFVLQPILVDGETTGVLLSGRMVERKPFAPPLDEGDSDTFRSIAALIAAFVQNQNSAVLKADNASLRVLATIDKLTGISNRRSFEESLAVEWKRAARHGSPLSTILLDVDHFKKCNDTYGHDVGDAILRQVAQRVTQGLRPGDIGARYGGEEFVVLLPETESDGAIAVAERVRELIEAEPMQHEITPNATVQTASFGVATLYPNLEDDPKELVTRADKALYEAKHAGRNRVCAFSEPALL